MCRSRPGSPAQQRTDRKRYACERGCWTRGWDASFTYVDRVVRTGLRARKGLFLVAEAVSTRSAEAKRRTDIDSRCTTTREKSNESLPREIYLYYK